MQQFIDTVSDLEVRFLEGLPPKSIDRPSTAVFQFVARDRNTLLVHFDISYYFQFKAFYQHKGKFYPHPYTLRTQVNPLVDNLLNIKLHEQITYEVLLYLELKRLEEFTIDDLKRYYEAIDKTVDSNEELQDFHDVYLNFYYKINGESCQYQCNNGQPFHLPQFISNPWTCKNTLIHYRYDAEKRDATFDCEMTLRYGNVANLQSFKIVLCLISNTIPPRTNHHALRWVYKLPAHRSSKEKTYHLGHSSGLVVARVFGPDLTFNPQRLHSINNMNYVRSCFEPEGFQTALDKSNTKDNVALSLAVIGTNEYPNFMKNRRSDQSIRQYLPFNEFNNVNNISKATNKKLIQSLKIHKMQCRQQLILNDDNESKTYSQSHVRLYVAAYDENDILLTETLYPPFRNKKRIFQQIRIIRLVQYRHELHANELAFVYCDYEDCKLNQENDICPFKFDLVFTHSIDTPDENQLLQLFNTPHMCIKASFVPNCTGLLQFQIPNVPKYDRHRVFLRLRHQSTDYNPSPIALCNDDCWIYYADSTSVMLWNNSNESNDSSRSNSVTSSPDIQVQMSPIVQPLSLPSFLFDSEDIDQFDGQLNTPKFDSTSQEIFSFSDLSFD